MLGALVAVPAALAALVSTPAERLAPFLTPGVGLLRPLSPALPDWPGGVNLLLASLSNGIVVGGAAEGVCVLLRRPR